MARQPVSQFGIDSLFGLIDFDREKWFAQWFEERKKHKALLSVEIHEPLQVGDEVSVVAISNKCHLDLSAPTDLWGLCLVAESLTPSTATDLVNALAMLKNGQGLDAKQGLAFLVQIYLLVSDELRAIGGDRATRGNSPQLSLLFEALWEPFGAPLTRREKLTDLKRRPLWQLETLLGNYWSRPKQYGNLSFQSPDGGPFKVLWLTIPPESYPPDEFDKIYPPKKVEQTDIELVKIAIQESFREAGILPPAGVTKSIIEPDVLGKKDDFRHSPDFRSVSLRGEPFSLTARQAQVVERLYSAHQNGTPEVGQDTLIVSLELQSHRLRDVFKSRLEAWGKLIVQGETRGTYRLNI